LKTEISVSTDSSDNTIHEMTKNISKQDEITDVINDLELIDDED
jgi:hypothetical protein